MYKYCISFQALKQLERVEKPVWYKFWKKPVTIPHEEWVRFSMFLYENEGEMLLQDQIDSQNSTGPIWSILFRALGGADTADVRMLQLEDITPTPGRVSNYITKDRP